ncbi:MAG: preprotein translocase subunit TatC [bacterium]|nr:preprotein translocase subunit TatC [bacterium]
MLTATLIFSSIAFFFFEGILEFLTKYFKLSIAHQYKLYITSIYEGFLTKIKLSVLTGIVFSIPVYIFNLVRFIYPGLLYKEKKVLAVSLLASFLLAATGFYIAYYYILPISIVFLTGSDFIPEQVGLILHYHNNLLYILQFLFYTVILFQFPVLLEVLLYLNLLKRKSLLKATKYVVVCIFIVSAVVTPPDVISQAGLAIPLILIYILSIFFARIMNWGT